MPELDSNLNEDRALILIPDTRRVAQAATGGSPARIFTVEARPLILVCSSVLGLVLLGIGAVVWSWQERENRLQQAAEARQTIWESRWAEQDRQHKDQMSRLANLLAEVAEQRTVPPVTVAEVPERPIPVLSRLPLNRKILETPETVPPAAVPAQPEVVSEASAAVPMAADVPPARVKLELPAEDGEAAQSEPRRKRNPFVKFLTNSMVIDSAVLTTSIFVPPSLPLALAQSRLGRRLTGRILKKSHTEKTVGAKVVRDLGDMPTPQRLRR